jgi:integrase
VPTAAETEAILLRASPQFWLIYLALRQCGARPGELCRATIADIDRINTNHCQLRTDHCQLSTVN